MPTKTFNLTEETITRLKAEANQSQTIEEALRFYWENKDMGRKLVANTQRILDLITSLAQSNKVGGTGVFPQPLREDEIEDPELREARENHPELTIKRSDEWDLIYWNSKQGKWRELY